MTVQPIFSPLSTFTTQAIGSNLSLVNALASGGTGTLVTASALIDISGQGQILSATSTFQDRLAILAVGATPSGIGSNFGTDFGSLAAEAQFLVDSFNSFQGALLGVQLNGLGSGSGLLAAQFAQAAAGQGAGTTLGTTLDDLAGIGITFTPDPLTGNGGHLAIDMQALQAAVTADGAGTFATLAGAVSAFRDQVDALATQAATTTSGLANLNASLLFGALGGEGTGTGLLSFADLFALQAAGGGTVESAAQTLLAINQFTLVSNLLA